MKSYKFLFLLFFFQVSMVFSQNNEAAYSDIKKLNKASLIVLLNLNSEKAADYRTIKKYKIADKIEKKLEAKNKLLIKLFTDENFHFCPVYFIEKESYGRIFNNYNERIFLNKELEIDTSIKLKDDNFLFLDFGSVYELDEQGNQLAPLLQNALIFKDKDLKQLIRPFPYYIDLDGVINPIVNFEKYVNNWKNNDNRVVDLTTYHYYLEDEFDLTEKESYIAEKIFISNVKLFNFLEKALKDK